MVDGILDGRNGADDSLVVRDLLVGVERNIEINLEYSQSSEPSYLIVTHSDQNPLVFQVDISDGKLV